jgi:membrane fusion protein (multidrug efflux system)
MIISSRNKILWNFLFFLISFCLFTSCEDNKQEITTDKFVVIYPIRTDSSYTQEYVAEIQSIQNVELRTRNNGFIERVYIDEGQTVNKGQLLFTLNASEYHQELAKAKSQLATALAELKQAEIDYENTQILFKKNIVSLSELEIARFKKDALDAKIEEAKATINLASINLDYTEIRAPFNGIINRIPFKEGALVEDGTVLTTISNNTEMFAYFNVSETDYLNSIGRENNMNSVKLKLVNNSVFSEVGKIETIDSEINRNTGSITYRARFQNPEQILKHGSSGKVMVETQLSNVLLIPQKVTFEVQENLYVFIVDENNIARQRQIVPEMQLANMYVVKNGLTETDKILFEGIQLVKDGDKIEPEFKNFFDLKY